MLRVAIGIVVGTTFVSIVVMCFVVPTPSENSRGRAMVDARVLRDAVVRELARGGECPNDTKKMLDRGLVPYTTNVTDPWDARDVHEEKWLP